MIEKLLNYFYVKQFKIIIISASCLLTYGKRYMVMRGAQ